MNYYKMLDASKIMGAACFENGKIYKAVESSFGRIGLINDELDTPLHIFLEEMEYIELVEGDEK